MSAVLPAAPAGAALLRTREFDFSNADFERVRRMIRAHAGIALAATKQDMVYSRLARRLRTLGDKAFASYLDRVERDPAERQVFVNALTTNLTSFFREAHHFDMLAAQLAALPRQGTFNVWCCAASTGEEPYSLAMTAVEAFGGWNPPVAIIASDIDTQALEHARRGIYDEERVSRIEARRRSRFFVDEMLDARRVARVRPELHRLVRFERVNLLEPRWPVLPQFEAIFCRNVMIYFDKDTQYQVLRRFAPLLRPQGRLYAGHSESFLHAADLFRPLGRTCYAPALATTAPTRTK